MAAEVNTPDHHPCIRIDATQQALFYLLFIALVPLPIFLLALILLGLLHNGEKFGTVKEGSRYKITQYPVTPPPLLCLRPSLDDMPTQSEQYIDVGIDVVLPI